MSEHSDKTKSEAEALWALLGKPEWKLRAIADAIQAAEDRGRRCGIEEAKQILADAESQLGLYVRNQPARRSGT